MAAASGVRADRACAGAGTPGGGDRRVLRGRVDALGRGGRGADTAELSVTGQGGGADAVPGGSEAWGAQRTRKSRRRAGRGRRSERVRLLSPSPSCGVEAPACLAPRCGGSRIPGDERRRLFPGTNPGDPPRGRDPPLPLCVRTSPGGHRDARPGRGRGRGGPESAARPAP